MADKDENEENQTKPITAKPAKDYSLSELASMLSSVAGAVANRDLSNTVFGQPESASSYDVLAANANAMIDNYMSKYGNAMVAKQRFARVRAVAAASGTGMTGVSLLDNLMSINPGAANTILGHRGMEEAIQNYLSGANGFASATGRSMGSVLDPHQYHRNMMFAASQGAMALQNNFRDDGTVNAKFTHGLSLPETSIVGRMILSEKNNYEDWFDKKMAQTKDWKEKHKGYSEAERYAAGILNESEISAFKNGTGMTTAAVKSFNDHIKKFQEEMNGFVSSISKVTGSFDSAISFLQDMTNGKAFSMSRDAAKSRRRASQVAANLRVAAADAGIDVKTLYNMMYDESRGLGVKFDMARGRDIFDQRFGERSTTAHMSGMTAGMFATWLKNHPGATDEEKATAQFAAESRLAGLGMGDAEKHNVLLAQAVRQGRITESKAIEMAASGDQNLVYNWLKGQYGENLDNMLSNKPLMDRYSRKNRDFLNKLNEVSLNEGTTNEGLKYNTRLGIETAKENVISQLTASLGESEGGNIQEDVEKIHREALLSDEALKAAGLTSEQMDKVREQAKKEDWSADKIREHVSTDLGGDEFGLNTRAFRNMAKVLTKKYTGRGDTTKTDTALNSFVEDMVDHIPDEITEEDIKNTRVRKKVKERKAALFGLKTELASAKDVEGEYAVLDKMIQKIGTTVEKGSEYYFSDAGFAKKLIGDEVAKNVKGDENTEKYKTVYTDLMARYQESRNAGLSHEDSLLAVQNLARSGGTNKGLGIKGFDVTSSSKKSKPENAEKVIADELSAHMDKNSEEYKSAKTSLTARYRSARDAGMSHDEAMRNVQDFAASGEMQGHALTGFDITSEDKNKQSLDSYMMQEASIAELTTMLKIKGLNEDQINQVVTDFNEYFRKYGYDSVKNNKSLGTGSKGMLNKAGVAVANFLSNVSARGDNNNIKETLLKQAGLDTETVRNLVKNDNTRVRKAGRRTIAAQYDRAAADEGVARRQTDGKNATAEERLAAEKASMAKKGNQSLSAAGRGVTSMDESAQEFTEQSKDENVEKFVMANDIKDAEAKNAQFGGKFDFNEDEAAILLKFEDKKKYLKSLFDEGEGGRSLTKIANNSNAQLRRNFLGKGSGKDPTVRKENIAKLFEEILTAGAGEDVESFKKRINDDKRIQNLGLRDELIGKDQTIDPRLLMGAYVHAARGTEDKMDDNLKKGYIAQGIATGHEALRSDEAVNYLQLIHSGIDKLVNQGS